MVERCWGREKRKSTVVEKKRKFSLGEVCRVAWRWRTCPVLWWWRCCSAVKGAVHEGASGARVTVRLRCAGGRSPQPQAHPIRIGAGAGARASVTWDPRRGWSPAAARGLLSLRLRLRVAIAARSRAVARPTCRVRVKLNRLAPSLKPA